VNNGNVLFLNFGKETRADEFLKQRLSKKEYAGSTIKQFQVEGKFLRDLRRIAIDTIDVKNNPTAPIIGDKTKAPNQFGIRQEQMEDLLNSIIQGTGK
jgi:hypothetical protein